MGYQQEVFALIARLSGSKNKVMVERSLCEYMGSLEGGVFLSQLLYWTDKGSNEWFYKGYKEWNNETFLSEYQVRQCTKRCIELGFLETKIKKANGAPTVHYKMDGSKFMDAILKFFRIQSEIPQNGNLKNEGFILEKLQKPVTETTTETTTEIKTFVADATPTPQQEMFGAVCEAIGWDHNTLSKDDKGQVAQAIGILKKANYTVDDIRTFMTTVWFEDWRWKDKGQHPTLKQLRQEIGKIRSVAKLAAPAKRKGMDGYREMLAGQGINL